MKKPNQDSIRAHLAEADAGYGAKQRLILLEQNARCYGFGILSCNASLGYQLARGNALSALVDYMQCTEVVPVILRGEQEAIAQRIIIRAQENSSIPDSELTKLIDSLFTALPSQEV